MIRQCFLAWQILVPAALALTLSLHQVAVTACVTEDSVGFIHYARQLIGEVPDADREPPPERASALLDWLNGRLPAFLVIEAKEQHPGYPLCLLAVHEATGRFLGHDSVIQWIRSGQVVSVLAGCLLAVAHFLLGRRLLGQTPAFAAGLLLATIPAWVYVRSDVLSDMSALAFLILSALFAVRLLEGGDSTDALLCGLTGALGYLFRIEALQVVIVAGGILLMRVSRAWLTGLRQARGQADVSVPAPSLRHALIMVVPLVLICLPYMHMRGSLLTKQARLFTNRADEVICAVDSAGKLVVTPAYAQRAGVVERVEATAEACDSGSDEHLGLAPPRPRRSLMRIAVAILPDSMVRLLAGGKRLFLEWAHDLGGFLLLPVLIGLFAGWRDLVLRPGQRFIGLLILLNLVMLPALVFGRKGYLDHRHVLPVAALSCFWCWSGLVRLGSWMACRANAAAKWFAALVLTVAVAGFIRADLSHPLHGERNGYRLAGLWLRGQLAGEARVIDPEGLASLYAGCDDRRYWDIAHRPLTGDLLDTLCRRHAPVGYIVVSDRYLRDHGVPHGLPASIRGFRLTLMRRFPASLDPAFPLGVGLYRLERRDRPAPVSFPDPSCGGRP